MVNGETNPLWCKNPQFYFNLKKPTHFKVIIKKTSNIKKTKNGYVGMIITKALPSTQLYKKFESAPKKSATKAKLK